MLYACEECRYLFEADREPEQCPDCGKYAVREATRSEREEYDRRANEPDIWE